MLSPSVVITGDACLWKNIDQETDCVWRHLKLNSAFQIYTNIKHTVCTVLSLVLFFFIVWSNSCTLKKKVHIRLVFLDKMNVGEMIS